MLIRRLGGTIPFVFALMLSLPAAAEDASIFTVRGIEVDATAESVTQARNDAMAQGQVKAFDRLIERLVMSGERQNVPEIGSAEIRGMVTDFSVANERTSDVRYLADMTVRFQPDAVRNFLQRARVNYAETQARPIVVVPLYRDGEGWRLWDSPNPWHEAWMNGPYSDDLVPFEAPLGDIDDVSAIDVQAAQNGDNDALRAIADRYGAKEVLLARAEVSGSPAVVTYEAERLLGDASGSVSDRVTQGEDEDLVSTLQRAASRIAASYQESWKQENVLRFGSQSDLVADVPIDSLDQWMAIRSRLESVPQVRGIEIIFLSRGASRVRLTYLGDTDSLTRVLAQRDLSLQPPSGGNWTLLLADGAGTLSQGGAPMTEPSPMNAPAVEGGAESGSGQGTLTQ